jgi:RNA polymerase sigma factor (sigma-70 family)
MTTLTLSPDTERLTEIIRGCQVSDRRAQKLLYEQYKSILFKICLRYNRNREEAEDMLQEGFIRIFKALPDWQPTGSIEGWMKRIVLNVVLEHHRKPAQKQSYEDLTEWNSPDVAPEQLNLIAGEELLKMIQELPLGYRTVFNMYAVEGYNHAEIADMLQISEGTSKSQYARARQQLQQMCHAYMKER